MQTSSDHNPTRTIGPTGPPPAEVQQAIRRRAQEIYEQSGRVPGRDLENWVQAEAEVMREYTARSGRKAAIVIRVEGVVYTGEYNAESCDGYKPGEWASGDPVPVRFDGDQMYLKRRNGHELETTIVKKVG